MNLTPDIFYEDPDTGIGFASIDAAAGYEVLVNALKRRPKAPEGLDPDLFQKLVVSAPEKVDMATDPLSVMRWAGHIAFPGLNHIEQQMINGRYTLI